MQQENRNNIVPLNDTDLEVADDNPDVRGWDVLAADGRRLGEVDQLLVDTSAMRVRYLDVDVDKELRGSDSDKHILVPIGYARLNENDKRVVVNELSAERVRSAPAYSGRIDAQYENSLNAYYGGTAGSTGLSSGRDTASATGSRSRGEEHISLSEEKMNVAKEREQSGEVQVSKHVETEHVRREVPVMREEVEIERRPATGGMNAQARIEDDEIRVPLMEEHAVMEKHTVPREEIVVRKRQVQGTETVEADLRREKVDIEREGNARVRDNESDRNR
jgi:uncharacterized protein (TIGR02271 family)